VVSLHEAALALLYLSDRGAWRLHGWLIAPVLIIDLSKSINDATSCHEIQILEAFGNITYVG